MKGFKDFLVQDVESVFLNEVEFADWHDINGVWMLCVIDDDMTQGTDSQLEGVFVNALRIHIRAGSLEERPVENEPITVDDRLYFVRSVSDEMGCWVIVAEANEQ